MSSPGSPSRAAVSDEVLRWADELVARISAEPLFQYASVFVPAPGRPGLTLAAQRWGSFRDDGEVRIGAWEVPIDGSICGHVFRTGKPALVVDVRLNPRYRGFPGGATRSELAVAIRAHGRVVGVANLESPQIGGFTIADLERVERLAHAAGTAFAAAGLGQAPGIAPDR